MRGGIRAHGHEFRATDLLFAGGTAPLGQADPDGWCIDLVDANETVLREIQAGYGGGAVHRLAANGIRLGSTNPTVNYGDGLLQEISIKLGAANTVAVLLKGAGTGLINNMLLSRVQVNAPQAGSGITPLARAIGPVQERSIASCFVSVPTPRIRSTKIRFLVRRRSMSRRVRVTCLRTTWMRRTDSSSRS